MYAINFKSQKMEIEEFPFKSSSESECEIGSQSGMAHSIHSPSHNGLPGESREDKTDGGYT